MTRIKPIFTCVLLFIISVIFYNWVENYAIDSSYSENEYRTIYEKHTSDGVITKQEDVELKRLYEEHINSGSFDDNVGRYYLYLISSLLLHVLVIVSMCLDKVLQRNLIVPISMFSLLYVGYQWELILLWVLLFYISCFFRGNVLDKFMGN
ncbi:hypothetical protein AB4423_20235 [Vibrio chagasii]|uniref:hypothetical protein n=2 Tax=Vibrio TaxID=662 RepID=UPI003551288F